MVHPIRDVLSRTRGGLARFRMRWLFELRAGQRVRKRAFGSANMRAALCADRRIFAGPATP